MEGMLDVSRGLSLLLALGLLFPPCSAGNVLACCSNPRCAELAGNSEAGVVLSRCGGACGLLLRGVPEGAMGGGAQGGVHGEEGWGAGGGGWDWKGRLDGCAL